MEKAWRTHPQLAGRFTEAGYPDDLQVLIHDGHPRFAGVPVEVVWVRVTGMHVLPSVVKPKLFGLFKGKEVIPARTVFQGLVANVPHRLKTVTQGQTIQFGVAAGCEYPILMTPNYLQERAGWNILPCSVCGLGELFDAPSDLLKRYWPDLVEAPAAFQSFCPQCRKNRGFQTVHRIAYDVSRPPPGLPLVPDPSKLPPRPPRGFKSSVAEVGKIIFLPNECTGCGIDFEDLPPGSSVTDLTFFGKNKTFAYGSYCEACHKKLNEGRLKPPIEPKS